MKNLIIALYKQLGQSTYSAHFGLFYETHDYNELAELVELYKTHGERLFEAKKPAD